MSEHLEEISFDKAIESNLKLTFPVVDSHKSRFVGKLRYGWCWLVAAALLMFGALPAMIFLWIIDRRLWLYPLCLWGARTWLKLCGARVKATGRENLDRSENYVFAYNHRSYLDTAAMFGHAGRRIGLVAKKELLKAPVFGQGMGFVNIIAIDRSNPEKALASMEKARKVLEDGYSFAIFVEGTRAMPGELLPFKKGGFHLALQTGAPVVPVAIKNTDSMMGKRRGTAFPGTIEMVFLEPIETKNLTENDLMDLIAETRRAVAEELNNGVTENGR